MAGLWRTAFDPRVSDHLISDEGEIVVDEVRRHPMAFVGPGLLAVLGVLIMICTLWAPVAMAWLPLLGGLTVILVGGYRMLSAHMDRFVITNMRVFRVHGILSQHTATMPMARILDISVHKPLLGRILNYGHFVFESAAENQGLRDIRFVARPDRRDLTIQRVIQRSGLRTSMRPPSTGSEEHPPRLMWEVPALGDGMGDDLERDDAEDPDIGDGSAESPQRGMSDEEWLAGDWSDRDAADYRSTAPHGGREESDRS